MRITYYKIKFHQLLFTNRTVTETWQNKASSKVSHNFFLIIFNNNCTSSNQLSDLSYRDAQSMYNRLFDNIFTHQFMHGYKLFFLHNK